MSWFWARKLAKDKSEIKDTVYYLRSITLKSFGEYYRPIHFDRTKLFTIEGEQIEMILCFYCDDIAVNKDHVYPVSALTRDILSNRITKKYLSKLPLYIVPACLRCNMLLKDRVFNTLAERRRYLKRRIRLRY